MSHYIDAVCLFTALAHRPASVNRCGAYLLKLPSILTSQTILMIINNSDDIIKVNIAMQK